MIDKECSTLVKRNKNLAVTLMLISAAAFSVMQVFVKLTSAEISTFEQVFFRNLVSLVLTIFMVLKENIHVREEMRSCQLPMMGRSVFGFLGILFFFYAVANAPQTDVAMLNRASPVFVTLFAGIFLKEKINPVKIGSVVVCLIGAYVAMNPTFHGDSIFPQFAALMAAVSSGIAYTCLSYCTKTASSSTIILHFSAFSTLAAGLLMLPNFTMPSPKMLLMLLLIGVFAALGQFFLTYAYQAAPASEVSIYQFSGVVFTALFSFLIFQETLNLRSVIGGLLILAAIFWQFEYHKHHLHD